MSKKAGTQKRIVRLAEIVNADDPKPKARSSLPSIESPSEVDGDPPEPLVEIPISPLPSSAPVTPTPSLAPPATPTATSVPPTPTSLSVPTTFPSLAPATPWPAAILPQGPPVSPSLSATHPSQPPPAVPSTHTSTGDHPSGPSLSGDLSRLVNAITSVKIGDKLSSLLPSKEDLEARAQLTARVSQFYALHCPDQQGNACKVAENHVNDVKLLNKKLKAKYGVDLSSLDEQAPAPPAEVVVHAQDPEPVEPSHVPAPVRAPEKEDVGKPADPVAAMTDRLLTAENELTEAREQLEGRICALDRIKVQLDEERDLRLRLEQQVEAVKNLFELETQKNQRNATVIQELTASNDKMRAFQKELEQECQVSLKSAAEAAARAAKERETLQADNARLAAQLDKLINAGSPCDATLLVAIEQHRRLAEKEIALLNEEIVQYQENERHKQEQVVSAETESARAELTALQTRLATAYQSMEADQETQYAMGQEVLNIQMKMDKMRGEERERVLDTILALSQMKEAIDEQVRVKNAEVQSLREQVGELEAACKQTAKQAEAEYSSRERGLQALHKMRDSWMLEHLQWGKLMSQGVVTNANSPDNVMGILLNLVQSNSALVSCMQERRELANDQEEKAHQEEENRTKQRESELGELREMLSEAQSGKQRLAVQSSDTIEELRVLVADMQQELEASEKKKKKLLVLPKAQHFYSSKKL